MLSKEEADNLFEKLNVLLGPIYNIGAVESFILDFTEKPKIKVQAGDIYKDKNGILREIVNCEDFFEIKQFNGTSTCLGGASSALDNLDLSKRYKLVEIEDVE